MSDKELNKIIKALFEARYLKRIPRSGTSVLLGNEVNENIPEHSYYVSLVGIVIHHLNSSLNLGKLLTMCITHDLEEVRTGDLNQVNRLYYKRDISTKAYSDMWKGSKLGKKLIDIHVERIKYRSPEAKAASDCDTLAQLIMEKEYSTKGNAEAKEWMEFTVKKLKTREGKKIAELIINARPSAWWEEIKNEIRKKHGVKPVKY